ncbi:MAG: hypothetical protein HFG80_02770 [Eubacterium sp.]|jgi:Uroporphyrinogen-III decarboxylase|nr:hypothetical protein [Eubacterium sp.]
MNEFTRQDRIDAVVSCREPDRVPFCINVNNYYSIEYGLSMYNVMKDARFFGPVLKRFAVDLNPDLIGMPITYPLDAFRISGYRNVKYPGPDQNHPVDTPFQFLDSSYMEEEDYEVYLKDPTAFLFRNVFARQYQAFEALGNLTVNGLCNASIYGMAAFGNPAVKEALQKMIRTGEIVAEYLGQMKEIADSLEEMGYPVFGTSGTLNSFDAFADNVRGIMDTNVDLLDMPDEVNEAMTRWEENALPGDLFAAKSSGCRYAFMPLHCGGEAFMSLDNFKAYYWPHVKRYVLEFINHGLTPMLFCEGSFTSRLDILADVPEGKVIYLFEDVDLAKAKKVLCGKACIMGGLQTQTLMFGTEEEVVEETKRALDICAPGGGFIMSNSIALDQAKRENIEIWRQTVEQFGAY